MVRINKKGNGSGVIEIKRGYVHVWSADLNQSKGYSEYLCQALSQDEKEKAKRYVYHIDRRRYEVCRGMLRSLLAIYYKCYAGDIIFKYGKNGKPEISNEFDSNKIHFNLSHSKDLALLAFTIDCEIGVDLEYIDNCPDIDQIAELIFSRKQIENFKMLTAVNKKAAIYNAWVRKEAFVKAVGDGLSLPLNTVEVPFDDNPAEFVYIQDKLFEHKWFLKDLYPAKHYAAALVAKKPIQNVISFHWNSN